MNFGKFLSFLLVITFIWAILSYIALYMNALKRTWPKHRYYVPPEKRAWKVFTIGDIYAWIYLIIWLPVTLFLCTIISVPFEFSSNMEELPIYIKFPMYLLFLAGPVGGSLIRIYVNKKY